MDTDFGTAYRLLESRMEALADAEGDVFLPSAPPARPAEFVLICMEPSLGRWARNAAEARAKVKVGFRNFLYSAEDFLLHYCASHYLCSPSETYFTTDLSKGAMLVQRASLDRPERYDHWYALLQEELKLVALPGASVISIGRAVSDHLDRRRFEMPLTRVIHYSGQAGLARKAGIVGHEREFELFKNTVSWADVLSNAERVLLEAGLSSGDRADTLSRLSKTTLSESRSQLMFNYKRAFETTKLQRAKLWAV